MVPLSGHANQGDNLMAKVSIPFKDFDEALSALPPFIGGIDLLGQHKTIGDLAWRVQFEIDLATEGEPNEIVCKRQSDTTKRWSKCRAYLLRCKALDL